MIFSQYRWNAYLDIITNVPIMKNTLRIVLLVTLLFIFLIVLLSILIRIVIITYTKPLLFSIDNAPVENVAIVFGAGLRRDNLPTPVLQDRLTAAIKLFKSSKVNELLMTGDHRDLEYNEPIAMAAYAMKQGVPVKKIIIDRDGISTFDSCYHAKEIFNIKSALLVTQKFHLPRAVFICNQLGLNAKGVIADQRKYRLSSQIYWEIRETAASLAAVWDIWIIKRLPKLMSN